MIKIHSNNNSVQKQLISDYYDILNYLKEKNYKIDDIPNNLNRFNEEGEAFSLAFSIQGILKYHGLYNKKNRIAYFSSISLNNSSGFTVSYIKFDKSLSKDKVIINGKIATNDSYRRVKQAFDKIRKITNVRSKAILISRNFLKDIINNKLELSFGKGIGTSASASAALAIGTISILYENNPNYINNSRLVSIFSRYLAGSGTRSAVGGFGLWLSCPKIDEFDSFAIRLDSKNDTNWINNIALITIPIESRVKTELAHDISVKSPFYFTWALLKKNLILKMLKIFNNDSLDIKQKLEIFGTIAEYDSLCLHNITMTGITQHGKRLIPLEPITLEIIKKIEQMENVYYSIDTGPSIVLFTLKNQLTKVLNELSEINSNLKYFIGKIEGPCKIINNSSSEAKLLEDDINKYT